MPYNKMIQEKYMHLKDTKLSNGQTNLAWEQFLFQEQTVKKIQMQLDQFNVMLNSNS